MKDKIKIERRRGGFDVDIRLEGLTALELLHLVSGLGWAAAECKIYRNSSAPIPPEAFDRARARLEALHTAAVERCDAMGANTDEELSRS